MAKDNQRKVAHKLFVDQLMSQKDIAEQLGVTQKTVGTWVRKYKWKALRDAKLNNGKSRSENIKNVIAELTEMMLDKIEEIKLAEKEGRKEDLLTLKKESLSLSQQVAMYNKTLEKLEKEYKITLSTYIDVMEDIFEALSGWNKKVYMDTIDFQKQHLQHIAEKLG